MALLSLALHLLLVLMLGGRGARPMPLATAVRLTVRLQPAAANTVTLPPAAMAAGKAEPSSPPAAARRSTQASRAVVRAKSNSSPSVAPSRFELPTTTSPPDASNAQAMLAQGKALLNQESRRQIFDPMFAPPSAKTTAPVHPLARVGALPEVGARQISGQIYQYTAANGRRFCVTAPPSGINTLTDSTALAVATNCPR